jgi:mannan endo-1,4-beta-mannosidase
MKAGGKLAKKSVYSSIVLVLSITTYTSIALVAPTYASTLPNTIRSQPVDPYATGNTLSLMNYLVSEYGHQLLSGQESGVNQEIGYINAQSGHLPTIQSFDLDQPDQMQNVINQAIAWGKSGGIVELSWHWVAPSGGRSFNTTGTTFRPTAATTTGTEAYKEAIANIKQVGSYLKQLEDANIPVLWRPLLEADGGWFWWGADGPRAFQNLWNMVYHPD